MARYDDLIVKNKAVVEPNMASTQIHKQIPQTATSNARRASRHARRSTSPGPNSQSAGSPPKPDRENNPLHPR
jgi:hypothetical protein